MIDECYAGQIGDGWCDDYNNKEECAFDGGDCCEYTCARAPLTSSSTSGRPRYRQSPPGCSSGYSALRR
ncbi:unnamed protein product [Scytosiphon promiscuus]